MSDYSANDMKDALSKAVDSGVLDKVKNNVDIWAFGAADAVNHGLNPMRVSEMSGKNTLTPLQGGSVVASNSIGRN